jgi:ACT domain-containing protein
MGEIMSKKILSLKEKEALVKTITARNKAGEHIYAIEKELGMSKNQFFNYRKQLVKNKPKVMRQKISVIDLPVVETDHGKLFMVYGNAATLRQFMKEMT